MDTMTLWFSNPSDPFLSRTEYVVNASGTKLVAVRGKTSAAFGPVGTFQWTSAVQAMTVIVLRTALLRHATSKEESIALISGDRGTLAASLDYCISKCPLWLLDMFGTDSKGMTRTRRLFLRSNPERKRGGDVTISVNQHLLEPHNIRCMMQGCEISSSEALGALINQIEKSALCVKRAPEMAEGVIEIYSHAA